MSIIQKLERLALLQRAGDLSDAEYEQAKAIVLHLEPERDSGSFNSAGWTSQVSATDFEEIPDSRPELESTNRGVNRFSVTVDELVAVQPPIPDYGTRGYQWNLVCSHRLANEKGYATGWWDGDFSGNKRGLTVLGSDYAVPFIFETGGYDFQKYADDEAKKRGYLGGFWTGEQQVPSPGISKILAIGIRSGTLENAVVSDIQLVVPEYSDGRWTRSPRGAYNDITHRGIRYWATLPSPTGQRRFAAALRLVRIMATSRGEAHEVIGF